MRGAVGRLDLDAADQYSDSVILEEHEIFGVAQTMSIL
jgi:hypothetical protein